MPKTKTKAMKSEDRAESKRDRLIALLQTKTGANIEAIVKTTGWLPHTGRAMISGLRKAGFKIETGRAEDGKTVYRILGSKKSSRA